MNTIFLWWYYSQLLSELQISIGIWKTCMSLFKAFVRECGFMLSVMYMHFGHFWSLAGFKWAIGAWSIKSILQLHRSSSSSIETNFVGTSKRGSFDWPKKHAMPQCFPHCFFKRDESRGYCKPQPLKAAFAFFALALCSSMLASCLVAEKKGALRRRKSCAF